MNARVGDGLSVVHRLYCLVIDETNNLSFIVILEKNSLFFSQE